ncbi:hypothetical protein EYF80_009418 [Liparis tanakae]|uniref:Uncharacterized protein n=1 Tax=Liparis tanakae TaxID=230148 RepID=A0A4Z2ISA6_9TELE|nr:hypothetical protein EYF80_009418 [Liparis tanakae]
MYVFLLTVDANHVLQDEDPLGQDLQGLPELLHSLALDSSSATQPHPFSWVASRPGVPGRAPEALLALMATEQKGDERSSTLKGLVGRGGQRGRAVL